MKRHPVADWQELSALYETADALDGPALDGWLAGLEAKAHPLLGQLQQMLAACSKVRGNGFLSTLPELPETPEAKVIEWAEGSRIGPYRLLRHIGAGGMAEVWLAQRDDGAFRRQVAIKLLYRTAASTQRDSFAQRFARERDILASLNHPNIAGLHDAGVTPAGQPWLALEYIEGEPLTIWCDKARLGIEARVRLFRQVLLAVQHAHANLVIHRDLKPGNILVTAQGEVRLLDFGIAKLLEAEGEARDATELTRMAGRPLTVQYASPEQLKGEALTTASDVYSLGVVLYELLCGQRPYEVKVESVAQIEQAIIELDPRAPSRRALDEATAALRASTSKALGKQLAGDLDAITLRALGKQPVRRYPSVEALRADIERWLGGEPVQASAPSTAYRLGKFALRHRLGVALGSAAVLSLVGVAAVAVVLGLQAREESARAVAARDFMLNIFARANQEKSRGADITARDLLETGRKDVLVRLAGQPSLQAELLRGIVKVQIDMGEYVPADSTYAELVRIYARLGRPRDEVWARIDHSYNALQMSNVGLAERLLAEATSLPGRPAGDAELNARMAEVSGWVAIDGGNPQRAHELLESGRLAAERMLGVDHLRTFRLGQALVRAERNLSRTETALALQERLRLQAAHVPGLEAGEAATMDLEQVNLLVAAGRYAEAVRLVETALPRCAQTSGKDEQVCRLLFLKRGQVLLKSGKVREASLDASRLEAMAQDSTLPYLRVEALILDFRLHSMTPGDTKVGSLFERVREFGQSESMVAMRPSFKAAALLALAEHRLRQGEAADAARWSQLALDIMNGETKQGGNLRIVANVRMLIGVARLQQRRPEDALALFREAQDEFARSLGAEHPTTQLCALNAALALAELGRLEPAMAAVGHAELVLREALGPDSPLYHEVQAMRDRLLRHRSVPPENGALESTTGSNVDSLRRGFFY